MSLEKKQELVENGKDCLFISPSYIEGGAVLVSSYETLKLYENIDVNTLNFAKKEIASLVIMAKNTNGKVKKYFDFELIFCGDFEDIEDAPNDFFEFLCSTKKRIVAVYNYKKSTSEKEIFIGFSQFETVKNYEFIYLDLKKLLEEFKKNNITCKIATIKNGENLYSDNMITRFLVTYDLKTS